MNKRSTDTRKPKAADIDSGRANLDGQYGDIGISAVAAALPYCGGTKRSAHRDNDHRRSDSRKRSVLAV